MGEPEALGSEAGVQKALAATKQAWEAGDHAAYAGLFTENADYIALDGTRAWRAVEPSQTVIGRCSPAS